MTNLGRKKEKPVAERSLLTPAQGFLVAKQRHFSPNAVCAPSGALGMNEPFTLHPQSTHERRAGSKRGVGRVPVKIKTQRFLQGSTYSCEGNFFLPPEVEMEGN